MLSYANVRGVNEVSTLVQLAHRHAEWGAAVVLVPQAIVSKAKDDSPVFVVLDLSRVPFIDGLVCWKRTNTPSD